MRTPMDEHHISHDPEITVMIPHREHQEIHNSVPIVSSLSLKMREYDALTKMIVVQKNWLHGFEKDFGYRPDVGLHHFAQLKKQLMKEVKQMVIEDLKKVKHIKGLGVRYLAGLLAYANPKRFRTLHRYLLYCGYKGAYRKFNRTVKSIVYQIVVQLIMHKDGHYYPLYLKIKEDIRKRFPKYRKIKIDRISKNRLGTFFLKEFYRIFTGG